MPIINRIGDYAADMTDWRRWMHRNPELGFELHKTAAFVADKLREFGVDELHEGIATTGMVAIINGQGDGPTIGLRADMDALPIVEATGAEYASETPGKMHACGHDGHTTMLLGAAKYLAETRNFKGRVALIFQPAEEGGGGGEVMVQEGIMDRFGITQVYGIHNAPQYPAGEFHTNGGALMAAVDEFTVTVTGTGGHAPIRIFASIRLRPRGDDPGHPDHRQPQPQADRGSGDLGHADACRYGEQRDPGSGGVFRHDPYV